MNISMKRTVNSSTPTKEKIPSYKIFANKLSEIKTAVFDLTGLPQTTKVVRDPSNSKNIKIFESKTPSRSYFHEGEKVGEEGSIQRIRIPSAKRVKSSSSKDTSSSSSSSASDSIYTGKVIQKLTLENSLLKDQLNFSKDQIETYQKAIFELSSKYETAITEVIELEEKLKTLKIDNKKIVEENEKLGTLLKIIERERNSLSKCYLQDALEAKILSIDQDRDEQQENYHKVLNKYIATMKDFLSFQEWTVSLIGSNDTEIELKQNEEDIRFTIDQLQCEIMYYQDKLYEKNIEKSYFTSIYSSLRSPIVSPEKTIQYTNYRSSFSPISRENPIITVDVNS